MTFETPVSRSWLRHLAAGQEGTFSRESITPTGPRSQAEILGAGLGKSKHLTFWMLPLRLKFGRTRAGEEVAPRVYFGFRLLGSGPRPALSQLLTYGRWQVSGRSLCLCFAAGKVDVLGSYKD